METLNSLYLKAFLVALSKLDMPLPDNLISQINAVGKAVENREDKKIRDLEEIAHQYEPLKALYEAEFTSLQENYPRQELLGRRPGNEETFDPDKPTPIDNTTVPILTDPNPAQAAKNKQQEITSMRLQEG